MNTRRPSRSICPGLIAVALIVWTFTIRPVEASSAAPYQPTFERLHPTTKPRPVRDETSWHQSAGSRPSLRGPCRAGLGYMLDGLRIKQVARRPGSLVIQVTPFLTRSRDRYQAGLTHAFDVVPSPASSGAGIGMWIDRLQPTDTRSRTERRGTVREMRRHTQAERTPSLPAWN